MYQKKSPHVVSVKANETVYICRCGQTKSAPLCDGSHKNTDVDGPEAYTATADESKYVCGCGQSKTMPWCDGAHNNL